MIQTTPDCSACLNICMYKYTLFGYMHVSCMKIARVEQTRACKLYVFAIACIKQFSLHALCIQFTCCLHTVCMLCVYIVTCYLHTVYMLSANSLHALCIEFTYSVHTICLLDFVEGTCQKAVLWTRQSGCSLDAYLINCL